MNERLAELLADGPVITDGACGTQLHERGLPVGECGDAWNLSHPERVEEVGRLYVAAGSQLILTNTFLGNRIMLQRYGLSDQAAELNRRGAEIARRAADGRARVFGSMGPTGVMLMMGEVQPADVEAAFAEQARALAEGGVDGIVIETFSDPEEAVLAVTAARQTGLPVVACLVFDSGKNLDRTLMGTTPEQAVERLTQAGADGIGSNCGQGIEGMIQIARRFRAATDLPLWIKANAGLPEMVDGRAVYRQQPETFAGFVPQLLEAGANFIGGCCGTTPDFIRHVRRVMGSG